MKFTTKYSRKGLYVHLHWEGKVRWRRIVQGLLFAAFLLFPDQASAVVHLLHHLW